MVVSLARHRTTFAPPLIRRPRLIRPLQAPSFLRHAAVRAAIAVDACRRSGISAIISINAYQLSKIIQTASNYRRAGRLSHEHPQLMSCSRLIEGDSTRLELCSCGYDGPEHRAAAPTRPAIAVIDPFAHNYCGHPRARFRTGLMVRVPYQQARVTMMSSQSSTVSTSIPPKRSGTWRLPLLPPCQPSPTQLCFLSLCGALHCFEQRPLSRSRKGETPRPAAFAAGVPIFAGCLFWPLSDTMGGAGPRARADLRLCPSHPAPVPSLPH